MIHRSSAYCERNSRRIKQSYRPFVYASLFGLSSKGGGLGVCSVYLIINKRVSYYLLSIWKRIMGWRHRRGHLNYSLKDCKLFALLRYYINTRGELFIIAAGKGRISIVNLLGGRKAEIDTDDLLVWNVGSGWRNELDTPGFSGSARVLYVILSQKIWRVIEF